MINNDLKGSALAQQRYFNDFIIISALFAVLMVLTNLIGTKLFLLFPNILPQGFGFITDYHFAVLTTGLITYPLTFLFTDVASEIWGRKRANHMVLIGFISSWLMLLVVHTAAWVPRADRYWADAAVQPVHGTKLIEAADIGAQQIMLDDAMHLLTDKEASAMVIGAEKPLVLRYDDLIRPQLHADGSVSYDTEIQEGASLLRWDHRGALQLTQPLASVVESDFWVIPATQIVEKINEGTIRVARPTALPPSGTLLCESGALASYSLRQDSGLIEVSQAWNSPVELNSIDLTVGKTLGDYSTYQPHDLQKNLVSIISAPGILLFASMLAYLAAQFLDVWLYHFWRKITKGKMMWLRNNGSTMISQMADTILVNGIFLPVAFGMGAWDTTKVIIAVYIVKMVLAWIDTPLIYAAVWFHKRRLGYAFHEDVPDLLVSMNAPSASEEQKET